MNLRDYKEALCRDQAVSISLFNDDVVDIDLAEFLELDQVKKFGSSLKNCMIDILNNIDQSFIKGAPNHALGLALTGGGSLTVFRLTKTV